MREPGEPQWRKGTISNMLRQRVYTGCLVQGTKENVQGKKSGYYRQKPKDEWIVMKMPMKLLFQMNYLI